MITKRRTDGKNESKKANITEKVNTPEIDKIDALLNDIYDLRKKSLAKDGEYGNGNLIFKEFRNKGYLDYLKKLKNELISKELSLAECENLAEDTIKQNGKWVNKGKEGTHGEFRTKKEADAQRKAMFAHGFKESMDNVSIDEIEAFISDAKNKFNVIDSHYDGDKHTIEIQLGDVENTPIEDIEQFINDAKNTFNTTSAYYDGDTNSVVIILDENSFGKSERAIKKFLSKNESSREDVEADFSNAHLKLNTLDEPVNETETLTNKVKNNYRDQICRIANNQVIVQPNGIFNIHLVKEKDVDEIMRKLQRLDFVEYVSKTASKYDFSSIAFGGRPQPRYYTITGKIKSI